MKKRDEKQIERERSIRRGESRVSNSEGVRTEKRKNKKAYHEREKVPKNYVSHSYK